MTGAQMQRQVLREARQLGIDVWVCVTQDEPLGGSAVQVRGRRWVLLTAPLTSREGYLVAMHELGHCADPGGWDGPQLDREARAWQRAMDRIPDQDDEDRAFIAERLTTYMSDRRYKRTAAFEALCRVVA